MIQRSIKFGDAVWIDRDDGGTVTIGVESTRYKSRRAACIRFFGYAEALELKRIEQDNESKGLDPYTGTTLVEGEV